jgi:hypothetical protein
MATASVPRDRAARLWLRIESENVGSTGDNDIACCEAKYSIFEIWNGHRRDRAVDARNAR